MSVSGFAERLQDLREKKKPVKSRRATSQLIGLGHDALRKYERGEREPGLSELALIAEYYGVSTDYLVIGKSINLLCKNHPVSI